MPFQSRRTNPTRLLVVALLLSFAGLLAAGSGLVVLQGRVTQAARVDAAAETYISSIKDIETGSRGYLIAGNEDYLAPYEEAISTYRRELAVLQEALDASSIDPDFGRRVVQSTDPVIAAAARTIELRAGPGGRDAARAFVLSGAGKNAMDVLRQAVSALQSEARAQIAIYGGSRMIWAMALGIISLIIGAMASAGLLLAIRRSRRSLDRSRTLIEEIMRKAPVGLALVDAKHRLAQWNASFADMVMPKVTGGTSWKDDRRPRLSHAPEIEAHLGPEIDRILSNRTTPASGSGDTIVFSTRDETRHYKASVFPITIVSEEGEERGAGLVLDDTTAAHEAEMELDRARRAADAANRAKSTFIANMSHELRTPLTAILGYCELIEDELEGDDEHGIGPDLAKISVNSRHLLSLINDVLDLSKIEAQKMEIHAVDMTVSTLMEEVRATAGGLMEKNGNRLVLEVEDGPLHTDDLKVRQILINLISNAAKFTHQGTVTLRAALRPPREGAAAPAGTRLHVEIEDTGVGMTQEQLDKLFTRFTQADETTTRKYGGTGLGLALTRALARMLGGTVEVASVEGVGSTFTLDIPADVRAIAALSDDSAPADGRAVVMVVDDDPQAREILTRHLDKEGFAVVAVPDGRTALERLETLRPIAVLLDVLMPGLDGWHVLRAIRTNPETAHLPVVMQTSVDDRNFAYALGATAFLKKPVERQQLAETLAGLPPPEADTPRCVLIVDAKLPAGEGDDAMTRVLEQDGWTVTRVDDPDNAITAVRASAPQLVLVDVSHTASTDRFPLISRLSSLPDWSGQVVALTPPDVEASRLRQLARAADEVVERPDALADLVSELRRFATPPPPSTSPAPTPAPSPSRKV